MSYARRIFCKDARYAPTCLSEPIKEPFHLIASVRFYLPPFIISSGH